MKTPFEAAVSRVYPHIVTRGARRPHFWSVTVSNVPLGDGGQTGPYAFVGVGMLDARGRITPKGRQTIDAHVAKLAEKHDIDYCVVWSENDCTWYDRDGNGCPGNRPPQACDTGNANLYDSLPYRLEDCWTVALPEGNIPSHICVVALDATRIELSPGENCILGCFDDPVREGERDPASPHLDGEGRLVAPRAFRGQPVLGIEHDWTLVGPVHPFLFDLVLKRGPDAIHHAEYRLCLLEGRPPTFVPEHGAGPSIRIVGGVLEASDGSSSMTKEQRLIGVARGQVELQRRIHIGPPSDHCLAKDRHIDAHPARLIIVLPMYEAADYRQRLTAIDETLVVHRRGDGHFQFELRPLVRLRPRSYAKWVMGLASDLEAGHVVIIVDRDAFLADIERLALSHVSEGRRTAVERAIQVVAERTRHQVQDHLDGEDDEACMGRRLIAKRPRRTKAKPGERDGLNCIAGIPTPRAEQLWNSILGEWCDVRTAQHGQAAWDRWVRGNRPDMPAANAR